MTWILLYFLIGFVTAIGFVTWNIKNETFDPDNIDDNRLFIFLEFILWPVMIVALLITGFAKLIAFLAEALSKWIS